MTDSSDAAVQHSDAAEGLVGAIELPAKLGDDHIALATGGRRDLPHDGGQVVLGVAKQRGGRMVVRRKCRLGISYSSHPGAGSNRRTNARDHEIVEAPGLDRDLCMLVAEHREADFLNNELVANHRNDADLTRAAL